MKTFAAFIAAMSLVSAVAAHATTGRRACDERSLAGGGPARVRAERRTRGRMAFARRFRSSPPAGEHRVVFLHVARRIALEPGRRTRLRRYARTGRTGRPRLPARPAAVLADSPSISRFRRPLPANPSRERIGPSPPSIRAPDGPRGSPPSGKPTGAPRRKAADSEKHADLIPEHVRANAPTAPPPKKRGQPKKETRTDDRARAGSPPKRRKLPYLNHDIAFPVADLGEGRRLLAIGCRFEKHASARLPRLEGLPRRSRPTKENGPHPKSCPVLDTTLDGQETTVPNVFDILPICHAKGFGHQGLGQDWEILGQNVVNSRQGRISAFLRLSVGSEA